MVDRIAGIFGGAVLLALIVMGGGAAGADLSRSVALFDVSARNGELPNRALSAEHALRVAGLPFTRTVSFAEALGYGMVVFSSDCRENTLSAAEQGELREYVDRGGILVVAKVTEPKLYDLFGISDVVKRTDRFLLRWLVATDPVVQQWLDDPREQEIPLGNPEHEAALHTTGYQLTAGTVTLARYEDGMAAVVRRQTGAGFTYLLGFSLHSMVLVPQMNRDDAIQRSYSNGFEPASDTLFLFLRGVVQRHFPHTVWQHTLPGVKSGVLLLSHDVDATSSMERMLDFADLERQRRIAATYFVTTRYVNDSFIAPFYPDHAADVAVLSAWGHEVASHSVGHFPDFGDPVVFPPGTPGLTRESYHPAYENGVTSGGTVCGELEVSRNILMQDSGATVTGFRSGYLAFNPEQIGVLEDLGYRYDSSMSANDVLTAFPYPALRQRTTASPVAAILELPMTISDVGYNEDSQEEMVATWLAVIGRNAANNAPTTLLIHPNRQWKLAREEELLHRLPQDVAVMSMDRFARFWQRRSEVTFTSRWIASRQLQIVLERQPRDSNGLALIVDQGRQLTGIELVTADGRRLVARSWPWAGDDLLISLDPPAGGDVDNNGRVDFADSMAILRTLVARPVANGMDPRADGDGDGAIGTPEAIIGLRRERGHP